MRNPPRSYPGPGSNHRHRSAHRHPAHIHRVRAGRNVKRLYNTGSSRTPSHLAHRARPFRQSKTDPTLSRLLPPSPASPGSGCRQLHRSATTDQQRSPFTSVRNHSASWRTTKNSTRPPARDDERVLDLYPRLFGGEHGGQPLARHHVEHSDRAPALEPGEVGEVVDVDHPRGQLGPLGPRRLRPRRARSELIFG